MVIYHADAQHGVPAVGGAPHLTCCKVKQRLRCRTAIGGPSNLDRNDRR
ncbi:hypothetical protein GGD62_004243 [Bradyrhizobium sp. ERR14]|nr:hypothetical protein [Bradyrhizobium sp. ERR14]